MRVLGTVLPAYVARPASSPATGVIVAHELFGVTPGMRGVADDLAGAGHLAIVPEFYHRAAPPGRWLPSDDAGRAEGFGYLHQLQRRHALDDTAAAIAWLRSQPGIERIGMVGFSAGGHLAFLAASALEIEPARLRGRDARRPPAGTRRTDLTAPLTVAGTASPPTPR